MKKYVIIIFLTSIAPILWAQQPSFTGTGPRVVAVGEQFKVSWNLDQQGSNFQAPNFTGFAKLMGPQTGSSSSVNIINGQVQRQSSYTYTYVLAATKPGKFTIQPAKITIKGRVYQSNSISIEVVQGQSAFQNKNKQQNNSPQGISKDDIFVDVVLSQNNVYVGEQLIASYKVFSRTNQIDFTDASFPSFDGFVSSEIKDIPNQLQRENVNGEIYYTGIFKKLLLLPQKSGDITIDPFELQCRVKVPAGYGRDWFGRKVQQYKTMVVNVKSRSKTIKVKPLPQPTPGDFTGAVGHFSFKSSIDKKSAKTNDAITLRYVLSGNGNLKLIEPFDINFPPDFDVYDPKIKDHISTSSSGMSGTKSFGYLIIPRHPGDFTIPQVNLVYFDVNSKSYKTLSSEAYPIHIEKGEDYENNTIISGGNNKENVKYIGKDIRYIKTDESEFYSGSDLIYGKIWYKLTFILSAALFLLTLVVWQKRVRNLQNIDSLKTKRAGKTAQKRLQKAGALLKANQTSGFYTEILHAIYGYVSHKLKIPVSNLNKEIIIQKFAEYHVSEENSSLFKNIAETCEFAQYAPSSNETQMDDIYKQATKLITLLENEIRKGK